MCDEVGNAPRVFDEIANPNLILWNYVIGVHAWNRLLEKVVGLYYRMLDVGVRSTKFIVPFALKAYSRLNS